METHIRRSSAQTREHEVLRAPSPAKMAATDISVQTALPTPALDGHLPPNSDWAR